MRWPGCLLLLLTTCGGGASPGPSPTPTPKQLPAIASLVDAASATGAPTPSITAPVTGIATGDEPIVAEDREANPRSERVKIRVTVDRGVKARVTWGLKRLGATPLEIERDRGSGPLDVTVTAPGFLPAHTRLFTDRDDKVMVRLFTAAEAPRMLGYKRPVPSPQPATSGVVTPP